MTVPEFLDALYETPREWRVENDGAIRSGQEVESGYIACPWVVVTDGGRGLRRLVTHRMESVCVAIFKAADNEDGHDPKIRAALLAACGLA